MLTQLKARKKEIVIKLQNSRGFIDAFSRGELVFTGGQNFLKQTSLFEMVPAPQWNPWELPRYWEDKFKCRQMKSRTLDKLPEKSKLPQNHVHWNALQLFVSSEDTSVINHISVHDFCIEYVWVHPNKLLQGGEGLSSQMLKCYIYIIQKHFSNQFLKSWVTQFGTPTSAEEVTSTCR